MTAIDEYTEELLSRGLDGDLDRAEMRSLYRAAAHEPAVPREMGALAELEDGLRLADVALQTLQPSQELVDRLNQSLAVRPKEGWFTRLWHWLHAPGGISFQPLSFAGGAALAVGLALAAMPVVTQYTPGLQRLSVSDLRFVDARADVDWTYQFVLRPGQTTRVALDLGDTLPLRMQFEAPEPTPVTLTHEASGLSRDTQRRMIVDGIMYASLRDPQPGDVVQVRNGGEVPVLVYAYTNGYGGSWVTGGTGQAL
ncbi:hypothetical protein [Magnetospira sp. QH-2]|uniref:hypothetical protein n=1 Tax=Magnetospira sp. (strain QH-2) TaxID=1288970 RepID=UPI0003E8113D|nr:hypothetical protein [Magnetospira sp. QH-2]CCQ75565.1 conserved protein of unknown function [Magnetospira sp. QH-2]